jgi:GNAT superfamily N-acetyltransferase
MVTIRLAVDADLPTLQRIEVRAGAAFRTLGMLAIADDEPPSLEELAEYQQAGRAWVADCGDGVVGFLLAHPLADSAHIEQVSVDPVYAHRRIGQQLITAAEGWAGERGLPGLTLTSYEWVPWNAPYYARLGFAVVDHEAQPPDLRAIRRAERERGLDTWPRVAMRRPLP